MHPLKLLSHDPLYQFLIDQYWIFYDHYKIDTEGHEKEVLEGALNLIKEKKIKYILLEFHLSKMYKNYNIKDLENFLDSSNFRLLKKYKFPFLFFEDRIYGLDSID